MKMAYSSSLLISEPPLVVIPSLAVALKSSDKAIILQQIHYWLLRSSNFIDGHKWVYNSVHDWNKQFPWLTEKTLQRYLRSLEDMGLLVTANYNKAKFDRTKWYTIDYTSLDNLGKRMGLKVPMIGTDSPNGMGLKQPTNTIDYTDNTTLDFEEEEIKKENDQIRSDYLQELRRIAEDNNYIQPTANEWLKITQLAQRLNISNLRIVVLDFHGAMHDSTITKPYAYLIKMMRDELQNQRLR